MHHGTDSWTRSQLHCYKGRDPDPPRPVGHALDLAGGRHPPRTTIALTVAGSSNNTKIALYRKTLHAVGHTDGTVSEPSINVSGMAGRFDTLPVRDEVGTALRVSEGILRAKESPKATTNHN